MLSTNKPQKRKNNDQSANFANKRMRIDPIQCFKLADKLYLPSPTRPQLFFINQPEHIQALQTKFGIDYIRSFLTEESKVEANVYIGPVAALGENAFGAYSQIDIVHNENAPKFLSYYIGKHISNHQENKKSEYIFEVSPQITIDAKKKGNWSRFINHSITPNCVACDDGNKEITFETDANISAHDQLFFNYGNNFFKDLTMPAIYLHRTDNWRSPHDYYYEKKDLYHENSLYIEKTIAQLVDIDSYSHMLATHLFVAVYYNDVDEVKKYLDNADIDLPSYLLEKVKQINHDKYTHQISPLNKQQNTTALMLACAIGNQEIIMMLVHAGADIGRCGLHNGQNALFYLLQGNANYATKLFIFKEFVRRGINLASIGANKRNILYYAIQYEQSMIIQYLFDEHKEITKELIQHLHPEIQKELKNKYFSGSKLKNPFIEQNKMEPLEPAVVRSVRDLPKNRYSSNFIFNFATINRATISTNHSPVQTQGLIK